MCNTFLASLDTFPCSAKCPMAPTGMFWKRLADDPSSLGVDANVSERYRVKTPCSCIALLTQLAAVGSVAAFLMGYNLSVLNTSLPIITADMEWCTSASTVAREFSKELLFVELQWQCPEAKPKQSLIQSSLILGAGKTFAWSKNAHFKTIIVCFFQFFQTTCFCKL